MIEQVKSKYLLGGVCTVNVDVRNSGWPGNFQIRDSCSRALTVLFTVLELAIGPLRTLLLSRAISKKIKLQNSPLGLENGLEPLDSERRVGLGKTDSKEESIKLTATPFHAELRVHSVHDSERQSLGL